jgi:hypothetical protein
MEQLFVPGIRLMAQIFGTSQAWRQVCQSLGSDGAGLVGPHALRRLVAEMEHHEPQWRTQAEVQVRRAIEDLTHQVDDLNVKIFQRQQQEDARVGPEARRLRIMLADLRSEGNLLVRLYHRLFTVPGVKDRLVRAERALVTATLELRGRLDQCSARHRDLQSRFEQHVQAAVQQHTQRLVRLQAALRSPELAGASAELEVAELLANLPDTYMVLHDVHLELDRAVRFDGNYLQTAQCDHIVVGPTGVFVIETKRWSRDFAGGGTGFSPFDQVARARFACQCILRDNGHHITARDIIANAGTHLDKPATSRTTICRADGVARHIMGRGQELTADQVHGMVGVLRRYLA